MLKNLKMKSYPGRVNLKYCYYEDITNDAAPLGNQNIKKTSVKQTMNKQSQFVLPILACHSDMPWKWLFKGKFS